MEKREKIVIILFVSIVLGLWFTKSLFESNLYTETLSLNKVDQEIYTLKIENSILEEDDLHLRSYTYIAQQAQKEGFIPAPIIYLQN